MSVRQARGAAALAEDLGPEWLSRRERGTKFGIRAVFWLATLLGRWPTRQLARILALYYALLDRRARTASRHWLERVFSRPARWREVYRHILRFAQVSIDRVFLLRGLTQHFEVTRTGNHHLEALVRARRGAILVGAHLGSFEAMRAGGTEEELPIRIVGHFENARMINALLSELDPRAAARVLHTGDDPIGFALMVRESLSRGELIAVLADRTGLNDKTVQVDFFGESATFSTGAFLLAAMLKCPIYLVFGLYFEPNQYKLFCEPFAETIKLPRGQREVALRDVVQRFAKRLESYCRKAPDNWFNFYDFWKQP